MTFQVDITAPAEEQIEKIYLWYRNRDAAFADQWFRGLMNAIATLQESPRRCAPALEHELFPEEVRQLLYERGKAAFRVLFTVRGDIVYILLVRHASQTWRSFMVNSDRSTCLKCSKSHCKTAYPRSAWVA